MFRTSVVLVVAFLGLTAGQDFSALTKNHNKTSTGKAPKTKTPHSGKGIRSTKVTGFTLCTENYDAYNGGPNIAGTGAFAYPVYAGSCQEAPPPKRGRALEGESSPAPIGTFSGTCSGNPWEGYSVTTYRVTDTNNGDVDATGLLNLVGECTPSNPNAENGCPQEPSTFPLLQTATGGFLGSFDNAIPPETDAAAVQALADGYCQSLPAVGNRESLCSAELRIAGEVSKWNKYPGSGLTFSYTTETSFALKGSTYTTDTQYSIGGNSFDPADLGFAGIGPLWKVELYATSVFDSITCVWAADAVTESPATVYYGAGKFQKYATKYVDTVELDTQRALDAGTVENPLNPYQVEAQSWNTELNVAYKGSKGYFDVNYL